MNRLLSLFALLVLATPVSAQRGLDEVVIPPAKILVSPTAFRPDNVVTVAVSFRQGQAFAPIGELGCSSPTATSSVPCDGSRYLGIELWHDDATGIRAPQPLGGATIDFSPPSFYTLVNHSFTDIKIPAIEPNSFLTMELIFFDKTVKAEGHVGLSVFEKPRVLGMRRYKWSCRAGRLGRPAQCRYVDVTD